jgi:hypothetical protein
LPTSSPRHYLRTGTVNLSLYWYVVSLIQPTPRYPSSFNAVMHTVQKLQCVIVVA